MKTHTIKSVTRHQFLKDNEVNYSKNGGCSENVQRTIYLKKSDIFNIGDKLVFDFVDDGYKYKGGNTEIAEYVLEDYDSFTFVANLVDYNKSLIKE